MPTLTAFAIWSALFAGALPCSAYADTLGELRAALARPAGTPTRVRVVVTTALRDDNNGKVEERHGLAQINAEDGPPGLRLEYPRALLQSAHEEENARAADPRAATPALDGLDALKSRVVQDLLAPAARLLRLLDRAALRGEAADSFEGRQARHLQLELSQEKLGSREAEYVKKYEGNLELWVGPDGLPLGARLHERFAGRAYIVFRFESVRDEDLRFILTADRLLVRSSEVHAHSSSTAGTQEQHLQLQLAPID